MRVGWFKKSLVFGIIVIFIGANAVSSINIKKSNDTLINIDSYEETPKNYNSKDDDGGLHIYFFVDVTITVHERIFCNYWMFDIQGREIVPFFNAIRLSGSYDAPVVDIKIDRVYGKTLDFTLTNRVFIFAIMLNNVDSDLPRFGYTDGGTFEGNAFFIIF